MSKSTSSCQCQILSPIANLLCLRKALRNERALERLLPNMDHARILRTQPDFISRTINHLLLIGIDSCLARLHFLFA